MSSMAIDRVGLHCTTARAGVPPPPVLRAPAIARIKSAIGVGWRSIVCAIVVLFLLSSGGCAAISLVTLGTIAGSAGSAVSAGQEVYQLGKLDAAEMARFDQAVLATQQAADDLGLHFKPYSGGPRSNPSLMLLPFFDDKGAEVKVWLERRAERLVLVRIDVGLFGSEVTAHLVLRRLRAHLPRPPGSPSPRDEDNPQPA